MMLKITIVLLSMTGFTARHTIFRPYPQEIQMAQRISNEETKLLRSIATTMDLTDDAYSYFSKSLPVDPRPLWQQSEMLNELLNSKFPTAPLAWDYLWDYGCYCHQKDEKFSSKFGYHGPALDELDELCRKSYRAQKCLKNEFDMSDSMSMGFHWNAVGYYPWYLDSETNEIVCNDENVPTWADNKSNIVNQFQLKNCEIEKEFVLEVIDLIENQGYEKNSAFHKMRNKKYRKVCRSDEFVRTGILNLNDECCGVGLSRKPYDTVSSQCCDDKIVSLGSC